MCAELEIGRVLRGDAARWLAGGFVTFALAGPGFAGPEGGRAVRGSVRFERDGRTTTIHASDRSIINFRRFDIGRDETVRFVQPRSNSRVLNRVTGPDPSVIAGKLLANGRVYIVNPAGVYFRDGAVVNVGSLYAAAGSLADRDFLRGVDRFTDLQGEVSNEGTLLGRTIALAGRVTRNHGVIDAPGGAVVLASGTDVLIGEQGGSIYAKITETAGTTRSVTGAAPLTENLGTIRAPGGRVVVAAGDTVGLAVHAGGAIRGRDVVVSAGGGTASVTGTIDASGLSAGERGGNVTITGADVRLAGATIDASGAAGGGSVRIGGDVMGTGALQRSSTTGVDDASLVRADALSAGEGGTVIVYADDAASILGRLSARGAGGGAGGFVETSGKRLLDLRVTPDISSDTGPGGRWLIDPNNIRIVADAAGNANNNGADPFTSTGNDSRITIGLITAALAMDGNVTVITGTAPPNNQQGDITLETALNFAGSGSLTLSAHRHIRVASGTGSINAGAGALALTLIADSDGVGGGNVQIQGPVDLGAGALNASGVDFIVSAAGPVTARGGMTLNMRGQVDAGAALNAGAAPIDIDATGQGIFRANITSGTLDIWVGKGASGNLSFTSAPTVRGDAISLRAGRPAGPLGSATPNASGGNPTFANAAGVAAPGQFSLIGDGTIDNARVPAAARFVGGVVPATYTIDSNNGAVTLNDPSKFTGAALTTDSFTTTTLSGGVFNLASLSLTAVGNVQVSGITAAGAVSTSGANLNISGPVQAGSTISALHRGDVQITAGVAAPTSITIRSGSDGTGNMTFANSAPLSSSSISLRAGDGVAGAGVAAFVNALTGTPQFRGPGGAGLPASVMIQQDGSIVDAQTAGGAQWNGGLGPAGVNYTLCSDDGSVTLATASKFAGSNVILCGSPAGTIITASFTGANRPTSIEVQTGPTRLNSGNVETTGAQSYAGPVTIDSAGNALTLAGSTIVFSSSLDSFVADQEALSVSTTGGVTFGGAVGDLGRLASLNVTGPAFVNGGAVRSLGGQVFGGPVTLDAPGPANDTTFDGDGVALNGVVGGALDGVEGVVFTRGLTAFNAGTAPAPNRLRSITANQAGAGAGVSLSGTVVTTGDQNYGAAPVSIDSPAVTLIGNSIGFPSVTGNGNDLTIDVAGSVTLGPTATGLSDLTVQSTAGTGAAVISGDVTTADAQTYTLPVTLTGSSTLSSTGGGDIGLTGGVNGGANDLVINTAGATTLGGTIGANSISTDAAGSTALSGASITTAGAQTFADAVTATGASSLGSTGGSITFQSTVDGPGSLLLDVDGANSVIFQQIVGGTTPLATLTVQPGGTTQAAANITTANGITICNALVLTGDAVFDAGAGRAIFCGTVDSDGTPRDFTVRSGFASTPEQAAIIFGGSVGGASPLDSFVIGSDLAGVPTGSTVVFTDAYDAGLDRVLIDNASAADAFVINAAGVTFGQSQKLLALGSLSINAPGGTATLGDITTLGD
ncbi:MAG: filamentous hemagglutinin N-terminal domain-containing protein, partial [Planctomycetota bacterium]|nr:filamentous hemagglutinin N-terminal domain-containing protein [Planctomycetota bacterium]